MENIVKHKPINALLLPYKETHNAILVQFNPIPPWLKKKSFYSIEQNCKRMQVHAELSEEYMVEKHAINILKKLNYHLCSRFGIISINW